MRSTSSSPRTTTAAKATVLALVADGGLRGIDAGKLERARQLEGLWPSSASPSRGRSASASRAPGSWSRNRIVVGRRTLAAATARRCMIGTGTVPGRSPPHVRRKHARRGEGRGFSPGPSIPDVRIGHVHLKVADIERSLAFYVGVLGFELKARYGTRRAFIAAGDYHHHIGLNTWESKGGRPPPPGHDRPLSSRHPLPEPRGARRRAPPADRGRHPARRRQRPRRQRGALSARSRRERRRALLGPPAGGMAEQPGRLARHVHQVARSRGPAQRGRLASRVARRVPGSGAHRHGRRQVRLAGSPI